MVLRQFGQHFLEKKISSLISKAKPDLTFVAGIVRDHCSIRAVISKYEGGDTADIARMRRRLK